MAAFARSHSTMDPAEFVAASRRPIFAADPICHAVFCDESALSMAEVGFGDDRRR